jgi:hypothetical protein
MKFSECFNFLGCLEVTLILRDFKTVTGKIMEGLNERKPGKHDEHIKEGHDDFILLELTRDAESVNLLEVESERRGRDEIEISVANVEFKKGKCIVVNVNDIIYAGVDADIDKEEIELELPDGVGLANEK